MKLWSIAACLLLTTAYAQTVDEKRSILAQAEAPVERRVSKQLRKVNTQVAQLQQELRSLYAHVPELYAHGAPDEDFAGLIEQITRVRAQLADVQEAWREQATSEDRSGAYALWHQPWTTVEQLVMDYGADDRLYLIPPEVGSLQLSVASNLPVPKECWGELLNQVLAQNGVYVRHLTPLLHELYRGQHDRASVIAITADRTDLLLYAPTDRVCFVLSPPVMQVRAVHHLLAEFADESRIYISRVGTRLLAIGSVQSLQELLKVYDFSEIGTEDHHYQMVALNKLPAAEMESIVRLYFDREVDPPYGSLHVHAPGEPKNALFLAGAAELVRQAKQLIEGVEAQVADPCETVVYTYTVHHSDAEELAAVLSQVYSLMRANPGATSNEEGGYIQQQVGTDDYPDADLPVDPAPVTTRSQAGPPPFPVSKGNFVVSPKTGTLIMVVEQDMLPKLKALLRKLDVPKRMVKIDVLLFEKRVTDQSRFGLDLLHLGSAASSARATGFAYGGGDREPGIVNFLISRAKERWIPSFDLVYDFLMSREDIRINASPSVTTVNNTEAKIDLVEEISIDTGSYVNSDSKKEGLKNSYSRAQYGIRINITPSINVADTRWGDGRDTITLDTSVLFDTPRPSKDNRPAVIRRQITNQVRIPDGQTVVLGGLRSRMSEDTESGLPLLSEIPCFGKIFGSSRSCDRDTEMFIFITPTIIEDTGAEMVRMQRELLTRRPGDLPEFLEAIEYAKQRRHQVVFERTLETMFGGRR